MTRQSIGKVIVIIILGAMIGTLFGELIGLLLPEGVVKEFFLRSGSLVLGPAKLNLILFSMTFGFTFKFNIIGFLGILIAIYILRWY